MRALRLWLCGAILSAGWVPFAAWAAEPAPAELLGMPLLAADDFETGESSRWEPAAPEAWKIDKQGENTVFSQFKHVVVKTPHRSPFNRALLKDLIVGDCVLDVRVQSTIKDYGHRDVCLFFGFQDPAHLFYVHLGKKADDHANQIFIVHGADRKKISAKSTAGTNWDDAWHHVRIVRKIEPGTIDVYFDDLEQPVMQATDKRLVWGQVGIGTFDDTANFDDVRVYGVKAEKPAR